MDRPLLLSNGEMAVILDKNSNVSDLYYPYVGLNNHLGKYIKEHKIGIFVDGTIHWLDNQAWQIKTSYYPDCPIGLTIATNPWLDIRLEFQDFVDYELNVFARSVQVFNLSDRKRSLKLFFHQAFIIDDSIQRSDTVQYIPARSLNKEQDFSSIIHYKGDRIFMAFGFNGQTSEGFDDYAVGRFGGDGDEFRNGTWCDATDGSLSKNAIDHGFTDSVIAFNLKLKSHDSARVNYNLACGKSLSDTTKIAKRFDREGLANRLTKTNDYWSEWLKEAKQFLIKANLDPRLHRTFIKSLLLVKLSTDNHGAVINNLKPADRFSDQSEIYSPAVMNAKALMIFNRLGYSQEVDNSLSFIKLLEKNSPYIFPNYYPDGTLAINPYCFTYNTTTKELVEGRSLKDSAQLLYAICQVGLEKISKRGQKSAWRKIFEKIAGPLIDDLTDHISKDTKLPTESYDETAEQPITTTSLVASAYGALNIASTLAGELKNTAYAINCRTIADEILLNAGLLWSSSDNYFYLGLSRQSEGIKKVSRLSFNSLYSAWLYCLYDDSEPFYSVAIKTIMQSLDIHGKDLDPQIILDRLGLDQAFDFTSIYDVINKTNLTDSLMLIVADQFEQTNNLDTNANLRFLLACLNSRRVDKIEAK